MDVRTVSQVAEFAAGIEALSRETGIWLADPVQLSDHVGDRLPLQLEAEMPLASERENGTQSQYILDQSS